MQEPPSRRTISIALLLVAEVAAMSCWFATNASTASIRAHYPLTPFFEAVLTSSVQAGFVAGALVSAIFTLPDRIDLRKLFGLCALAAALATGGITLFSPVSPVVPLLRFVTGVSLAGVYPVGMAIAATWARGNLGLLIGLLVGSLTLGSALPHLAAMMGGLDWRVPCLGAAAGALVASGAIRFVDLGPNKPRTPQFRLSNALQAWRDKALRLANFGYFGHMWELYAMWAWIGAFVAASFKARYGEAPPLDPRMATFIIVGAGALGALAGGFFADRFGRTVVTSVAMVVSGLCALLIGFAFGGEAWVVLVVGIVWGVSVIADSAQFSAAVAELSDDSLRGTMLTAQTCVGFLITLASIHIIPLAVILLGWRYAFALLAIGPFIGTAAMLTLRNQPEAARMAAGRR